MNSTPRGWLCHGQFPQTPLMAGVLPCGELHWLAGKAGNELDALLADVSIAAASDVATCGLGAPDKSGARESLAGWFGQPTGASTGVAILTSSSRAETLSRSIAAAALARGVSRPLPVAVLGLVGDGTHAITAAHARVAELAKWFDKERGVGLGLVVIDGLSLPIGELLEFRRNDRAVLCVCDAPVGVTADSVVIEVGERCLTLAKAAQGEPWAREFDLDLVKVQDAETLTVRPGKAVEPAPMWKAVAPVAVAPVAQEPEPVKIVSKVAVLISRGAESPERRAELVADGYTVVSNPDLALPRKGEIVGGLRAILVCGDGSQDTPQLRGVMNRIKQHAESAGVGNDIVVHVAA